jgi:aspartate oxidase
MTAEAGVLRSAGSLADVARAAGWAAAVALPSDRTSDEAPDPATFAAADELRNLATVGAALAAAAAARTESRGAHARTDFPDTDPAQRVRYVHGGPAAG